MSENRSSLPLVVHALAVLGANAIPVVGILRFGWSATTVLALLWLETLLLGVANLVRIACHRRWTRAPGHRMAPLGDPGAPGPTPRRRPRVVVLGNRSGAFARDYATVTFVFGAAHGFFLAMLLTMAYVNELGGDRELWRLDLGELRLGVSLLAAVLVAELVVDLFAISRWSFVFLKRRVESTMGRVLALHLAIIFGVLLMSWYESPIGLLAVFLVVKACLELLAGRGPEPSERAPRWFLWVARKTGRDGEAEYRRMIDEARRREAEWNGATAEADPGSVD